ncbi:uncharacterized protein LOC129751753 isoform X2 [Uranotaenia lowii]|uniref:uncharacterized protein LOC129751753 isoform X2 n=1 Tax=Uranotaenia lowii TaxID=190385 RepID=UPI00247A7DA5|nr:uncharacterized protein LOC129751753 isoform X2 [Uranotaenia lowii]
MVKCAVNQCLNYEGNKYGSKKLKFFWFPRDPKLKVAWLKACGRNYTDQHLKICSEHFSAQDYRLQDILLNTEFIKQRLRPEAVPSLNLPAPEEFDTSEIPDISLESSEKWAEEFSEDGTANIETKSPSQTASSFKSTALRLGMKKRIRIDDRRCVVYGCQGKRRFFKFPPEFQNVHLNRLCETRRKKWLEALSLTKEFRWQRKLVCDLHFTTGQPARHTDTSHPDWVPSLALPESSKRKSQSRATSDERFELIIPDEGHAAGEERLIVSSGQEIKVEDLLDGDEENFEIEALEDDVAAIDGFKVEAAGDLYEIHEVGGPETTDQDPETTDDELETKGRFPFTVRAKPPKDVQIPPTRDLEKKNAKLLETLDELKQRVADLEKRLGVKNRDFECLKDSKKCSFFTGFHSVLLLKRIFGIVGPFLDQQDTRFTKEQMFVMTLTKLKLNVMYTMLAYDYDVSAETIVKSFQHTITTMHRCLKHTLVPSPKEVAVQKTPSMFSAALGHKRIYILCPFHTKTENSSGVRDSMSNFMSDKKIETVKFLIAVHPDGTFAFVSDGYSVKHTDLYMVNNSGFLSCVEADDVVLVDKRFEFMSDMVGLKKATLIVSNYLHSTIKNRAESLVGIIRLKYNYLAGPLHTKTLLPIEEDFEISNVVVKVACIVSNLNKAQKAVKSVPGESSLQ